MSAGFADACGADTGAGLTDSTFAIGVELQAAKKTAAVVANENNLTLIM
jgi:hypothetical protein